jgi:autophagy-related protein 2
LSQNSEDEELGTGTAIPLSGWIAGAIKGIIDRLELHIENVALCIHFDAQDQAEEEIASSLRLQFDALEIEGVTSRISGAKHWGKRQIRLKELKATLSSTSAFFESLQRASSVQSQAPTASSPSMSRELSSLSQASIPNTAQSSQHMTASIHSHRSHHTQDHTPQDRFADASDEEEEDDEINQFLSNPLPPTRTRTLPPEDESGLFPLDMDVSGLQASRFGQSQDSMSGSTESSALLNSFRLRPSFTARQANKSPAGSSSGSSVGEDMIESRFFTHEEAQSMYESAMSDVRPSASHMRSSRSQHSSSTHSPIFSRSPERSRRIDTAPVAQSTQNLRTEIPEAVTPTPHSPIDQPETPRLSSPETPLRRTTSPTKIITKELLSVDEIALLVPWAGQVSEPTTHDDDDLSSTSNEQSTYFEMPGAFSTDSTHQAQTPMLLEAAEPAVSIPDSVPSSLLDILDQSTTRADLEVVMGTIDSKLDLSSGKLLVSLIGQVLQSVKNVPQKLKPTLNPDVGNSESNDAAIIKSVSLRMSQILLSIQETMPTPGAVLPRLSAESKIILQTKNNEVFINLDDPEAGLTFKAHDFSLGFADQKLISFASPIDLKAAQLGASTIFPGSDQCDIFVQYQSTESRGPELHVHTGALFVNLDLPKIDEKLTYYGGLSGILDISNSIVSHSTILKSPPRQTPRPVSSDGSSVVTDDSPKSSLKINSRISGVRVTLQGREHAIGLESNTIRTVVRDGNVRVKAGHIWTIGPFEDTKPLLSLQEPELIFSFAPEESDLDTLISLINPTRDPYEDEEDIMLDILLRQRKKGSLLRCSLQNVQVVVEDLDVANSLKDLAEEVSKFSNVAKYLPEDDRPGILSLILIEKLGIEVQLGGQVGTVTASLTESKIAHVGLPALLALQVGEFEVWTEASDMIKPLLSLQEEDRLPMVMAKMVGDEIEPTVKVKVFNLSLDYRVSTLMAFMGLSQNNTSAEDLAASMAQSVATIRGRIPSGSVSGYGGQSTKSKPLQLSILFRDCGIGLNPTGRSSKGLLMISDSHAHLSLPSSKPPNGSIDLRKASFLAIDDVEQLDSDVDPALRIPSSSTSPAISDLERQGYQSLITIQSTIIALHPEVFKSKQTSLLIDIAPEVVIIETCADSTQTMIEIFDGLKPPSIPETKPQYLTDAMLPQDLMNEFSGEEFESLEQDDETESTMLDEEDEMKSVLSDESWDMIGSFYSTADGDDGSSRKKSRKRASSQSGLGSTASNEIPFSPGTKFQRKGKRSRRYHNKRSGADLLLQDTKPTVKSWNSALKSQDDKGPLIDVNECPFRLSVRMTTFVWNLFDGYDWLKTREAIGQAVEKIRQKATERRSNRRRSNPVEDDPSSEIGDTLFQSIWISVPADRDGEDLGRRINRNINKTTETSTEASTITTAITADRPGLHRGRSRTLKLGRSRRHKASIEVRSLNLDLKVLPPNKVETQSIINIEVKEFEVYDHVPTSTWRKFVTRLRDASPQPDCTSMLYLTLQNVKPRLDLAATELVLGVRVMPLRLHVDQDTLDFITRFFEFKDDSKQLTTPGPKTEQPFIQRIEVFDVPLCLDYKPKKVDYVGLRSGRTKELANFITLDGASMVLRHVILFGILGFDKLHTILNNIWVADITRRQLPSVLQGLAPIRPLVNVGQGIRQLIVVPLAEYQKDGSIVRSVRKGAFAFAKQTSMGLARLGAQVAMGTGTLLSGAEALLVPSDGMQADDDNNNNNPNNHLQTYSASSPSRSPTRAVSLYANQPLTIIAGLRSAVRHLEKDLTTAKDAIIGVGTDLRESENATDVVKALGRAAPVVILKPAIGASKAIGSALLGAGNALDPGIRGRLEDVSNPLCYGGFLADCVANW